MKKYFTLFIWLTFLSMTFLSSFTQTIKPLKFSLTESVSITIEHTADGKLFRMGEREPIEMEKQHTDLWFVPDLDMLIEIIRENTNGNVKALQLNQYQETVYLPLDQNISTLLIDAPDRVPEVLDELIPRLMIANNVPGVSMAGIEKGRLAWTRTYGVKTAGSDKPVTDSTLFEAASMSKAPFAYATLRLVDREKFDLDMPLVEISGEPYEKVVRNTPEDTLHKKITARMVFQHQTGFPNWSWGDPLIPSFVPGTDVGYSGEGFEFCQRVIEDITGLSLQEFMTRELFKPLGMQQSSFVWNDHFDEISAAGHDSDGNVITDRTIYNEPGNAAYTLYTTPSEYALFLIDVMGMSPSQGSLLSEESRIEMLTPTVLDPNRTGLPRAGERYADEVYWGLSWRAQETSTGTRFYHGGSNSTGFRCLTEFNPSTGYGLIIMTNGFGGSTLREKVFAIISKP